MSPEQSEQCVCSHGSQPGGGVELPLLRIPHPALADPRLQRRHLHVCICIRLCVSGVTVVDVRVTLPADQSRRRLLTCLVFVLRSCGLATARHDGKATCSQLEKKEEVTTATVCKTSSSHTITNPRLLLYNQAQPAAITIDGSIPLVTGFRGSPIGPASNPYLAPRCSFMFTLQISSDDKICYSM